MRHKKSLTFFRLLLTVIVSTLTTSGFIVFGNAANENSSTVPVTENITPPTVKQGITEENGKIYFYNEDGTLFKEGYKEVSDSNNNIKYYYFQDDGSAFTDG